MSSIQIDKRHYTHGKVFTPTAYSVVENFFIQDSPDFNGTGYDLTKDGFGILDKTPERWINFHQEIARLNAGAEEFTTYKVLYAARHGQAYHNVAEEKYGTPAWNSHWSRETTDGEIVWGPDPQLTPLGISQAQAVNVAWKQEIAEGAPTPLSLYSSPLSRSASTLHLTWHDILIQPKGVTPVFKENLRETIGLHTCDKRSTKSHLTSAYPSFKFDVPFSEHDQLWSADFQESERQQTLRTQQVLNHIFATDSSTFISITAHGGTINTIFNVVGHRRHPLGPGQFVPMVIKASSDPDKTGRNFAGGQSVAAPPLPKKTAVAEGRQNQILINPRQ